MQLTSRLRSILTVTVVLATISMSACSMRIMYNYLDWIIPFYIDDYVTLTDHQENLFDSATIQFLKLHRAEELPKYERLIIAFREAQSSPMSQQQVLIFFERIETLWAGLLKVSMESLLELSTNLTEQQIQEINDALIHDIKDLKNKFGDKNDTQRHSYWREKMTDAVNDGTGRITNKQSEIIELWSTTRRNTTEDWLIYRNDWRIQFMELLNNRQAANYIDDMSLFLLHPQKIYNVSYRRAVLENRLHFAQLLADLSSTLTPGQREHLQQELTDIIDDLRALQTQ